MSTTSPTGSGRAFSSTTPPWRFRTGAKTGLVGRNGSGKTTLFRLITGEIPPETGSISVPKNARIGTVAQEAPGGPESP